VIWVVFRTVCCCCCCWLLALSLWAVSCLPCRSKTVFTHTHFLDTIPSPDWGLFMSTIMWSYTGWDSLGCIAGEVQNPSKTYIRGSLVTICMVTFTYVIPVLTSVQVSGVAFWATDLPWPHWPALSCE
jgi:amino acid transporter